MTETPRAKDIVAADASPATPAETTQKLLDRVIKDGRVDKKELGELLARKSVDAEKISDETRQALNILKTEALNDILKNGLTLGKEDSSIVTELDNRWFLDGALIKKIKELPPGESITVTLDSAGKRIVESGIGDRLFHLGMRNEAVVSEKNLLSVAKENIRAKFSLLTPENVAYVDAMVTDFVKATGDSDKSALFEMSARAEQAMVRILWTSEFNNRINFKNTQDVKDFGKFIGDLKSQKPAPAAAQTPAAGPAPTPAAANPPARPADTAAAKPPSTPSAPAIELKPNAEKFSGSIASLGNFLAIPHENSFWADLMKPGNKEALKWLLTILELKDSAPYKEIKDKTKEIQVKLGQKADGAFGPQTLKAWKSHSEFGAKKEAAAAAPAAPTNKPVTASAAPSVAPGTTAANAPVAPQAQPAPATVPAAAPPAQPAVAPAAAASPESKDSFGDNIRITSLLNKHKTAFTAAWLTIGRENGINTLSLPNGISVKIVGNTKDIVPSAPRLDGSTVFVFNNTGPDGKAQKDDTLTIKTINGNKVAFLNTEQLIPKVPPVVLQPIAPAAALPVQPAAPTAPAAAPTAPATAPTQVSPSWATVLWGVAAASK